MTQVIVSAKNMFLAVIFEESVRNELAHNFRLPVSSSVVRWEEKINYHLTLGYIGQVEWQDRLKVVQAFYPLRDLQMFIGEAKKGLALGVRVDSLCLQIGPYEKFLTLHEFAGQLLAKTTYYKFDNTYKDYIPHIKIQGIRHYIEQATKDEIISQFLRLE